MGRGCGIVLSVVADRDGAGRGPCAWGALANSDFAHPRGELDSAVGRMNADPLEHIDQLGAGIDLVLSARHQQALDEVPRWSHPRIPGCCVGAPPLVNRSGGRALAAIVQAPVLDRAGWFAGRSLRVPSELLGSQRRRGGLRDR